MFSEGYQEVGEAEVLESLQSLDLAVDKELGLTVSETLLYVCVCACTHIHALYARDSAGRASLDWSSHYCTNKIMYG